MKGLFTESEMNSENVKVSLITYEVVNWNHCLTNVLQCKSKFDIFGVVNWNHCLTNVLRYKGNFDICEPKVVYYNMVCYKSLKNFKI